MVPQDPAERVPDDVARTDDLHGMPVLASRIIIATVSGDEGLLTVLDRGFRPIVAASRVTSAQISSTSPGCIGRRRFCAARPAAALMISMKRPSSTGV